MRKRCEGHRNQSPALPSRASCSRCFMALNPIVPFRKRKNKNLALSATFFDWQSSPTRKRREKASQQLICCTFEPISVFKEIAAAPNRKKVAERARFLFSKRVDRDNRAGVAAGGAETGSLPQAAVPRRRRRRSWQCCNEGGCLSGVISVADRAAAGRCCGGRVSAMGRILCRTREAPLRQRCRTKGVIAARRSDPTPSVSRLSLVPAGASLGPTGHIYRDYCKPLARRGILFFILYNERRTLRARPT